MYQKTSLNSLADLCFAGTHYQVYCKPPLLPAYKLLPTQVHSLNPLKLAPSHKLKYMYASIYRSGLWLFK